MATAIRKVVGEADGEARQGQARRAAAGRERQHRGDERHGRQPDDARRTTSRRSTSSPRRTRSRTSSACKLGPRAGRAGISTRMRLADTQTVIAICRDDATARSGPTTATSSSRSAPASRTCPDGRAHPHQRSGEGQARRGHRDQDADLAHHGVRLPRRHARRADPARHHHVVRLHLQRRGDFPRRAVSRRSPPIRSSRSTPSRPRAARSRSNGPATTASRRTPSANITVE